MKVNIWRETSQPVPKGMITQILTYIAQNAAQNVTNNKIKIEKKKLWVFRVTVLPFTASIETNTI